MHIHGYTHTPTLNTLSPTLASSVCGKCKFISSPSKSALYGPQQHSLNLHTHTKKEENRESMSTYIRYICTHYTLYTPTLTHYVFTHSLTHSLKSTYLKVLQGKTLTRCAIIDILCSDGWRLNSTASKSSVIYTNVKIRISIDTCIKGGSTPINTLSHNTHLYHHSSYVAPRYRQT